MNTRFSILQAGWAIMNPSKAYEAKKAMNGYRAEHPRCEVTGSDKQVQIHHIIPVWRAPELAADKENMIALSISANIHMLFGHAGNFQKRYVSNIKEVASKMLALTQEFEVVHRDSLEVLSFRKKQNWLSKIFGLFNNKNDE